MTAIGLKARLTVSDARIGHSRTITGCSEGTLPLTRIVVFHEHHRLINNDINKIDFFRIQSIGGMT